MDTKRPTGDKETDYEVVATSRGQKPAGVVSVRLKPDEMELLVALSEASGRTLSETLRLGLRCLSRQPAAAGPQDPLSLRLETRGTQAEAQLTPERVEWSQPVTSALTLVLE